MSESCQNCQRLRRRIKDIQQAVEEAKVNNWDTGSQHYSTNRGWNRGIDEALERIDQAKAGKYCKRCKGNGHTYTSGKGFVDCPYCNKT